MLSRITAFPASRFTLSMSRPLSSLVIRGTHNPNHSKNKTKMKFQSSILSVLALTAGYTSAFAPVASRSLNTCLSAFPVETAGETGTESFRMGFKSEDGAAISPWHDIPLEGETEGSYNMVVEIPKMTKAKMEVATKEENNPIAQDIKKGVLRDYHGPIFWNYGTLASSIIS